MTRSRKITVRLVSPRGRTLKKITAVQYEHDSRTWREFGYAMFPFANPINVEIEEPDQWRMI